VNAASRLLIRSMTRQPIERLVTAPLVPEEKSA
jgi:hypothetical protein